MKYKYLVISGSEDGTNLYPMETDTELNEYLAEMSESYNDQEEGLVVMDDFPEEWDTNYWKGNTILILQLENLVKPKVKLSI